MGRALTVKRINREDLFVVEEANTWHRCVALTVKKKRKNEDTVDEITHNLSRREARALHRALGVQLNRLRGPRR